MILIADSGSTKTDWLANDKILHSQGINPFHQTEDVIRGVLRSELLPQLEVDEITDVMFYGSGVRPELEPVIRRLLGEAFPRANVVEAHNDLLGAARALFGHNYGIASILGTGANSCLYDGKAIVEHTPALGYILGDEGSGAVLGKRFIHDLYGGILSDNIRETFEKETKLTLAEIIKRVYRQPMANRFLASLSEFITNHLDDSEVRGVVVQNFIDFLRYHISPYCRQDLPVSFVGSVAWYYKDELHEAAERLGYKLGTVLKTPLAGLIRYHQI